MTSLFLKNFKSHSPFQFLVIIIISIFREKALMNSCLYSDFEFLKCLHFLLGSELTALQFKKVTLM